LLLNQELLTPVFIGQKADLMPENDSKTSKMMQKSQKHSKPARHSLKPTNPGYY
jgi:hypothetical protein